MGGWIETAVERLELPLELMDGAARLTLVAGRQVRIENHRCLCSFTPDTLEVDARKQRFRVRGDGLRIVSMNSQEILVDGTILTVEVDHA